MESEFVDIGIGEHQVSDWQCPNDNNPDFVEWLKEKVNKKS